MKQGFPARFPRPIFARLSAAGLALLPALAAAHPGHYHPVGEDDEFDSVITGFLHPLTGMDHLVLAVAVGWLAFLWKGGKARLPLGVFLGSLALGAFSGRGLNGGAPLEIALAVTLVAAGVAFIVGKNLRIGAFTLAAAAAGFIHGFAHGSEAATGMPFPAYAGGFIAGTAALLGIGSLIPAATSRFNQPLVPRIAGGALVALGSISLIQAL